MERPRFLTGQNVGWVLAVVGLYLNTACISAGNTEAKPIPQPPVPTATPARFWEGSRLPPVSEGQFTTNKGTTYWRNFTTIPFNPKSAERMLQTFEHFAQGRFLAMPIFDPQDPQRNEIVSIQTWPEPPADLILNLIPDGAPLPGWAKPESLWGVSERSLGAGRREAFVRITGQDNGNLKLGRAFCESRLNIEASSPQVLIIAKGQLDSLLREATCNAYNLAVAARRQNNPYERYKRITEETLIVIPLTLDYRLQVLSEQDYLDIPQQTGAIGPRFNKPPTMAQRYFFWG